MRLNNFRIWLTSLVILISGLLGSCTLTPVYAQTPCTNQFPGALNSRSSLCDVGDNSVTSLSSTITNSTAVITVNSTDKFAPTGVLVLDFEQMVYSSKTPTTFTISLRGANGTTATSHAIGTQVKGPLTRRHVQTQNDSQIAAEVKIGTTPTGEQNSPVNGRIFAGRTTSGTSSWQTPASLGLVSESSLTTGNIPEWDGTQLVDSPLLDNGTYIVGSRKLSFGGAYTFRWDSTNINPPSTSNIDTGARVILYAGAAPDQVSIGLESGYMWHTAPAYKFYFAAGNAGVTTLTQNGLAINNATLNVAAALQVDSTTRGLLPPRMTTTQRDLISSPPEGLVVYNLTDHVPNFYNSGAWIPYGTINGGGSANAYPIFNGTSTLQNGYLKQRTNFVDLDGAVNPTFRIYTQGTSGQTNFTAAGINATVSLITIGAEYGGTYYPGGDTSVRINALGGNALGKIDFSIDGTPKWQIDYQGNLTPSGAGGFLGTLNLPTHYIVYDTSLIFDNSTVAQWQIKSTGLNTITFKKGDDTFGAKLELASGTFITAGSGSPEGVVTSSPGGIYQRTSDGHIWRKDSGIGTNTNWIDMTAGAGTTINATDGVIPYRSSATTFADSPLTRTSSTNVQVAGMLQLGGTSSSFPAIKNNGGSIQFRKADDSADTTAIADLYQAGTGYQLTAYGGFTGVNGGNRFKYNNGNIEVRSGADVQVFKLSDSLGFLLGSSDNAGIKFIATSVIGFTDGSTGGAALQLKPKTATPADPSSSSEINMYVKGNKFVIQYNDAGTVRYKYLDLTSTTVTWTATTTAP